jgi:diguanylate cyclase (GGDEF)-like protein
MAREKNFRSRLLLLILIALLPGVFITFLENFLQFDRTYRDELQDLEQISNAVGAGQEKAILSIKQALATGALIAEQALEDKEDCSQALREFLSELPYYNNMLLTDLDGKPVCSAKPLQGIYSVADRPYFQRALKERKITTSGYLLSRTTGKPSVAFALPIVRQGQVQRVAIVSTETRLFSSILENIRLPERLVIGMTDDAGRVVSRRPHIPQVEGQPCPVKEILQAIRARTSGFLKAPGVDGKDRLYWLTPVFPELGAPFTVFVGSSYMDILRPFGEGLAVQLLGFGLTLAIALIGIWQLGDYWMVKPLTKILSAIGSIGDGGFNTKTGVDYQHGEFGTLARHVDDMADALSKREADAKASQEKIDVLARTDYVTGLPNRIHFKEYLERKIADNADQASPLFIMFVDLDQFRKVNDAHSAAVGDQILQVTGQRIRGAMGDCDLAARLSADSFACVISSCADTDQVCQMAERIVEAIRQPYLISKKSLHMEAKIGISAFPSDSTNGPTLLKYADTAMRRAKKVGRKKIIFFDQEIDAQTIREWGLHTDLEHAVERDELLLHYQPKIYAETGKLAGYEALVRWKHPVRGMVSPAEFIPLAESSRLIVPIGDWILMEACRQGRRWMDEEMPRVPIAVNISAEQFQHGDVLASVRKALAENGYPSELLELEITEGVLLRGVEKELADLRSLGIALSVDDFGTGYSSLSYLRHLPVSKLKVDQTFIRDLEDNAEDRAITTAIVGMAKSLQLSVVAEGVETKGAFQFLRGIGCDEIQGYYCSRPLPPQEMEAFCRSWALPEA